MGAFYTNITSRALACPALAALVHDSDVYYIEELDGVDEYERARFIKVGARDD